MTVYFVGAQILEGEREKQRQPAVKMKKKEK